MRSRHQALAWFATWVVCAVLTFYWLANGQQDPALILAIVQAVPIFYAGEALDRSRRR
jgi:hypothetical protein